MEHKHEVGLYIGRFQPFHKGHKSIVEAALKQCDKLIIGIGSSQEIRTKRNPFSYEEREQMILRSFFAEELYSRIIIIPIPDRTEYSDDASWGANMSLIAFGNYVVCAHPLIFPAESSVAPRGLRELISKK